MKILYYHRFLKRTEINAVPGHFFYGVLGLDKYGIETAFLENSSLGNRLGVALKVAFQVIFHAEAFDVIYGATPLGLELLVFLKCLGLFRKPIVVWQHRAPKSSPKYLVNKMIKFYYRGFTKMIMFTNKHIEETIAMDATTPDKLVQMQWGPDTQYYDNIIKDAHQEPESNYFCSTGRENRDFPTLIKAFQNSPASNLRLYTTRLHGNMNNEQLLMDYTDVYPNIQVSIVESKNLNGFLSKEIFKGLCAVVSCHEHGYTVGLTSLLEAMALKTAIITSDNPYFPFDVEKEGFGIKVPYGDVEGWTKAVQYISQNPDIALEMGRKGRQFVDEQCNSNILSYNVAKCLYEATGKEFPAALAN